MKRLSLIMVFLALAGSAWAQTGIMMPLPPFSRTYTYATAARGFYFQSPVNFTVKGVRVPDEASQGQQIVAIYALAAKPNNTTPKASELLFYKTGVVSSQVIPCSVAIKAGQWFCILGMCGSTSTSCNSYGTGPFKSSIAGGPTITLNRLAMNSNLITSGGIGALTAYSSGDLGRVEVYVEKQAFAKAENYGQGTSAKPVIGNLPLPQPTFSSTYSAPYGRGYGFLVPTQIEITAWEVPDEKKHGMMNVAIYKLPAAPAAYPSSTPATPVYFHAGAKSGAPLVLAKSLVFKPGEFLVVLGSCGPETTGYLHNSYGGTTPWPCTLGQHSITLNRVLMQSNTVTSQGVGNLSSYSTGSIGRTHLYLRETVVPTLTTGTPPAIGYTATLDMRANLKDGIAGGIFLSVGRLNHPLPMGTLLVAAPFLNVFPLPGGTGTFRLPIPNNTALVGGGPLNLQGFVMTLDNFGLTNGVEWYVGK